MNFPSEWLALVLPLLGDGAAAFLRALEQPPALALRVNPNRPGAADAAREYADSPVPWWTGGAYLVENLRPGGGILHFAGAYYLQEASAMAPAAVLNAQPGERVLDLCAAPGGKTTQIAASMGGRGLLIANEPDASRARVLTGNLERLGVLAAVTCELPEHLAGAWPGLFDAVLADAPCSGEGMFRRDPAARGQWSPQAPAGCAKRQREILSRAARLVRPGGRLVYSTCTFNAMENEGTVEAFLRDNPDFAPEEFSLPGAGASEGGMLRLWPHLVRGDGQFMAKFRKAGERRADIAPRAPRDILETAWFARDVCPLPDFGGQSALLLQGNRAFAAHRELPDAKGLKLVSPGVALFRIEKNRAEPEHQLAMALPAGYPVRRAALAFGDARKFLLGEALPWAGEAGWTLAEYAGMPLGWGKASGGTLKNHLPKGLRRAVAER